MHLKNLFLTSAHLVVNISIFSIMFWLIIFSVAYAGRAFIYTVLSIYINTQSFTDLVIYYRGFTYFSIQYPVLKYGYVIQRCKYFSVHYPVLKYCDILQRFTYFSVQYPVLKYGDMLQRLYDFSRHDPVLKYVDLLQRLTYFSIQYPVLKYGDILQRLM